MRKKEILDQAMKNGWLLVFSHGYRHHVGYLQKRRNEVGHERYFIPVDLTV